MRKVLFVLIVIILCLCSCESEIVDTSNAYCYMAKQIYKPNEPIDITVYINFSLEDMVDSLYLSFALSEKNETTEEYEQAPMTILSEKDGKTSSRDYYYSYAIKPEETDAYLDAITDKMSIAVSEPGYYKLEITCGSTSKKRRYGGSREFTKYFSIEN